MTASASKGLFGVARRLLSRVRRGVSQFIDELGRDLAGPRSVPAHVREGLPDAKRELLKHQFQRDFEQRTGILARRLATGELNVQQWRGLMAIEIRNLHVAARVMGAGGFGNLTEADLVAIEKAVREQLNYLTRWAQQLGSMDSISEDQVRIRASLYGGASNETYFRAYVAAAGVPDLPFYPAQKTECRTNCGCGWDIKPLEGQGNFDAYWRRHKNDSCTTCIARERACNPLQIRGGSYEPPSGANLYAA